MKIPSDGHVELHPMDESKFKNWISGIFYSKHSELLNDDDLKKIVRILTAKAEFDGNIPRRSLDIRVRGFNESEYNNNNSCSSNYNINNVMSVSSVSSVSSNPKKITDLLLQQILNRLSTKHKDFFIEDDWNYQCAIWPSLQWDKSQAKEAFNQLLQEGKITEIEPGKYRPTTNNMEGNNPVAAA
jgi:hypothetical protein